MYRYILIIIAFLIIAPGQLFANKDNTQCHSKKTDKCCATYYINVDGDTWADDFILNNRKCKKECKKAEATLSSDKDTQTKSDEEITDVMD